MRGRSALLLLLLLLLLFYLLRAEQRDGVDALVGSFPVCSAFAWMLGWWDCPWAGAAQSRGCPAGFCPWW